MTSTGYPEIVLALQEWAGCWAEPWDYTTSHGWFRIKLAHKGHSPCAILLLVNCDRISFVHSWEGFNPTITEYAGQYGKRYHVSDGDRLDVDCGNLSLSGTLSSYTEIPTLYEHAFGKGIGGVQA